jgi:hypothetical protein
VLSHQTEFWENLSVTFKHYALQHIQNNNCIVLQDVSYLSILTYAKNVSILGSLIVTGW